ncbi:MAG: TolC family protein [Candidatus Binatia bacterium]
MTASPRRRAAGLVALALLAARTVGAQAVLTLEEASARALATHEQIRAADAERDRAAVAPWRALSALGPTIREVGSYTRETESLAFPTGGQSLAGFNPVVLAQDVLRSTLEVGQPVYTHQFWGLRDIGRAEVRRSADGYRAARQDVLLAVAAAYYEALRAATLSTVAHETQQLADTQIAHAEARVRAGQAVRSDVLRAQSERARADQRVAETTGQVETSLDVLRRLTGRTGAITVTDPPPRRVALAAVEPLIGTALGHSPDLQEREAALAAARGEVRRRVGALYPTLGVQFDYQNLNHEAFADRDDFWTLTLRAQVPLLEAGGTRWLDVAEQRAVVARLEAQVAGFRRDLEVSVRRAWITARTLEAQRTATEQEVTLATESHQMLSDQYAAGVATNLDVLSALTALDGARANLAAVRYAHATALVQLDRLVGTLGEPAGADR